MWIITQDGSRMYNVKRLEIQYLNYEICITGDDWLLGKYSTEEKAMKVMDMLQWSLDDGVVEMPLDDDVEELYNSYDNEALFVY